MDLERFIKELGEKLKAKGIPMLEDDLLLLCEELFKHMREFDGYENDIVKALAPVVATVLEPMAKEQIEKIDPSDNPPEPEPAPEA